MSRINLAILLHDFWVRSFEIAVLQQMLQNPQLTGVRVQSLCITSSDSRQPPSGRIIADMKASFCGGSQVFTISFSITGLQKIPPSVWPGAGGATCSGDCNEGGHHAAREVSRQSAAGHSSGSWTWLSHSGNNPTSGCFLCNSWETRPPCEMCYLFI